MNLAVQQAAFVAELAASDDQPCSNRGMEIHRNAYRARLVETLEVRFERTLRWVGSDAFAAAAAHYVITHPPCSWTLDAYGAGFPDALAALFADDPEVAELAWLEWHMQQAFAAHDAPVLSGADLAAMDLTEGDWAELRFAPAAGLIWRSIDHDVAALWHDQSLAAALPTPPQHLLVWRQNLSPRFRQIAADEFAVLRAVLDGAPFGAAAAMTQAPQQLGAWLASWIADGLFSAAARPDLLSAPRGAGR